MKKITLFLFSLFCVLSFTVNAQDFTCDDGSTIPSSYLCDGSIDNGNASWGSDCPDGSDELLTVCCDLGASAYVGLCDDGGDGDDGEVVDPEPACEDGLVELAMFDSWGDGWGCAIENFEPCQILTEAALRSCRCAALPGLSFQ